MTQSRNVRSRYRCSMCPAIHINSRSWLRSSSTHEPSDPPPRVVYHIYSFSPRETSFACLGNVRAKATPASTRSNRFSLHSSSRGKKTQQPSGGRPLLRVCYLATRTVRDQGRPYKVIRAAFPSPMENVRAFNPFSVRDVQFVDDE